MRLDRLLNDCNDRRFGYGRFDCCILAAAAIDAITGSDYEQRMKCLYANGRQAVQYLRQFPGMREAVTYELERLPVDVRGARRGDIVMFSDLDKHGTLGVCVGCECAVPGKPEGIAFHPTASGVCAWRID